MNRIWSTLRGYIWWTYQRGSFHYDVMVTLILLFVFVSPLYINFKDKPTERQPHPSEVVVIPDGKSGHIYRISARAITATEPGQVEAQLRQVIEPIAGEVEIKSVEQVKDASGHVVEYRVSVHRP